MNWFFKKNYPEKENYGLPDYQKYRFVPLEFLVNCGVCYGTGVLLLYFFYHSLWVFIPAVGPAYLLLHYRRKSLMETKKQNLEYQFKDWISAVSGKLQAGHSIENAFRNGGYELSTLYGEKSDVMKEIRNLDSQLENNVTLEVILEDLAKRSGSENIRDFTDVFVVAKRSGGNLREIIAASCELILAKMETEREIQTIIHGRKVEQMVMCLVPFGLIGYIGITSPGYFQPLYHNLMGVIIMTICLGIYLCSVWWSYRLIHIEV